MVKFAHGASPSGLESLSFAVPLAQHYQKSAEDLASGESG